MRLLALICLALLTACSGASHIPPPWELPGAAAGAIFENAAYGAKRKRVKQFLSSNYDALKTDLETSSGPALRQAFELSHVPVERQPELISELQNHPEVYFANAREENLEAITVAFMVYGN